MRNEEPDVKDIAKTPVTDLNLDKREIPQILIDAQQRPYQLEDGRRCQTLISEISQLDEVLGPDFDLPEEERSRISAGRVAKTVVGSFIPFRGLIREVSGANDHDRRVRAAIQAGLARRGFLKGIGLARGCAYPARPASKKDIAQFMAEREGSEKEQDAGQGGAK